MTEHRQSSRTTTQTWITIVYLSSVFSHLKGEDGTKILDSEAQNCRHTSCYAVVRCVLYCALPRSPESSILSGGYLRGSLLLPGGPECSLQPSLCLKNSEYKYSLDPPLSFLLKPGLLFCIMPQFVLVQQKGGYHPSARIPVSVLQVKESPWGHLLTFESRNHILTDLLLNL